MSTRRTDRDDTFDHGAQYFTFRDPLFDKYVQDWLADGVVSIWDAEIGTLNSGHYEPKEEETLRYVAVPGMNQLARHLAEDLDIHLETKVAPPEFESGRWLVSDTSGYLLDEFDLVVTSAPAVQSAELLAAAPELRSIAQQVTMTGCWAVMLAFEKSLDLPFDAAFVDDSPLAWIACNSSKPGREGDAETWVLHASPGWSEKHLERQPSEMLFQLTEAFWAATGLSGREPEHLSAHRWRYALPPDPLPEPCLFDPERRIGACGDWCGGPRVEGAFLSGYELAGRIQASLSVPSSSQ